MQYLILIIALSCVIGYGAILYFRDKKDCYSLYGSWTGFDDFYFTTGNDIVVLINQLWIKETVCDDLSNYKNFTAR